jgi:NADP-dependent 3-hydroxy acid dehydrogenase YdfG
VPSLNAANRAEAVVISGCSSGMGHAPAERLAKSDQTLYATARPLETIADLEQHGCRPAPAGRD